MRTQKKTQLLIALIILLFIPVKIAYAQILFDKNSDVFRIKDNIYKFNLNQNNSVDNKRSIHTEYREDEDSEKKDEGELRQDEPDMFAKYYNQIRTKTGQKAPAYKPNYKIDELEKALSKPAQYIPTQALNWIERGPGNVSGRTRGLLVDPSDATGKTWFAGSVGGGVWKTTNMGAEWINMTPNLPNIATGVLAQSPANPNVIYCGTGEGFFNIDAINGAGIFKSTDHGASWSQLKSTLKPAWLTINRIIVDPQNANILLACTNGTAGSNNDAQIIRSADGGATWTSVYTAKSLVQQILADPVNFLIQYATINQNGIIKSTDGGLTWNEINKGIPQSIQRIELAVSKNNHETLYAAIEDGAKSSLFVTTNGGLKWLPNVFDDGMDGSWLESQGWYNNTIGIHPYNDSVIYLGGVALWKAQITKFGLIFAVVDVEEVNTGSFFGFVNYGGPFFKGQLGRGKDFFSLPPFTSGMFNINDSEFVSVEIRFGPGKTQKAHRFVIEGSNYIYKDYVSVPFEVWDIKNNVQLMVSFRDYSKDGQFNPGSFLTTNTREYLCLNLVKYSADAPDVNITKNNGLAYRNMYTIWPTVPDGSAWNPANQPESLIRITWGQSEQVYSKITQISRNNEPTGIPYVHVDHHNIMMIPKDKSTNSFVILNGNDGGVAYSTDQGNSWIETLAGGFNTTQFYGVDKKHGYDEYFGGTQDNGTFRSAPGISADKTTKYKMVIGGDGFNVLWNYKNPDYMIGSSQYNYMMRSTDGGNTWISATNGYDLQAGGSFISQFASSQSDPDVIFTNGIAGIFRSDNFGELWENLIPGLNSWEMNYSYISTPLAVSIADPQIVWSGCSYDITNSGLFVSQDQGGTFTKLPSVIKDTLGSITGIGNHPAESQTAFLTYSISNMPKILRTTDLGKSWQDITGFKNTPESSNGFPNAVTYCVLVMPYNTNIIWAGTEIGLFESTDNGVSWHYSNSGLPAVSIWQMKIVDDQVVIATHGRGIFSVTLQELKNYTPPLVTLTPLIKTALQDPTGLLVIKANLRSIYDSTLIIVDNTTAAKYTNTVTGEVDYKFALNQNKKVNVQLVAYKSNKAYKSLIRSVNLLALQPIKVTYINTFDIPSADFSGTRFSITKPAGFSSPAIHSSHPYKTDSLYEYYLLTPIKIASSNALLEYRDIAIVEPNEAGSVFGGEGFYDYVVIEGSKDGVNWIPLEPGYTCTANAKWNNLWSSGSPDSIDFVQHKINLLDKFSAGDIVLLRFRLHSDQINAGWGWAIDNLAIQQNAVGVKPEIQLPAEYCLYQNFPNPFNPSTVIRYDIIKDGKVSIKVFDILGKEVFSFIDEKKPAGKYEVKL